MKSVVPLCSFIRRYVRKDDVFDIARSSDVRFEKMVLDFLAPVGNLIVRTGSMLRGTLNAITSRYSCCREPPTALKNTACRYHRRRADGHYPSRNIGGASRSKS